jgi:hypothetical protein
MLNEQYLLGRSLPEQVVVVEEKPDICQHIRKKYPQAFPCFSVTSLREYPDNNE